MENKEILEEIKRIEKNQISPSDFNKENKGDYFKYKKGQIPILISAPHGTKHERLQNGEEEWKDEDEYTSAIAIILAKETNAHVIYTNYKTDEDPNYDKNTKYKDKIQDIIKNNKIKFVMDLHGAKKEMEFKICVGIINDSETECSCPKFRSVIEEVFENFQNEPLFNEPFRAAGKNTITSFIRLTYNKTIESAQFEIRKDYRKDNKKLIEMFKYLKNIILEIKDLKK